MKTYFRKSLKLKIIDIKENKIETDISIHYSVYQNTDFSSV